MNSNRCPDCGGVADHHITDISGNSYYKCNNGLTSLGDVIPGENPKVSHIISCETIINSKGHKFTGTVAYDREGKTNTLAVTNGKERR